MSLWIAPFGSRLQGAEYTDPRTADFNQCALATLYSHRSRAMPGHPRSIFKDSSDLSPFICAKCYGIFNDPVSLHSCNCRVCATCADSAIDHRAGTARCQLCGEELEQRSGKYVSKIQHARPSCMHGAWYIYS